MAVPAGAYRDLAERELDDLVLIDAASEQTIVDSLAKRFRGASIYSWCGPVLISLNPYKLLLGPGGSSIYDDAVLDSYVGKYSTVCS